jgi:1-deoxy-D-xylulose-5-phosphate synthase
MMVLPIGKGEVLKGDLVAKWDVALVAIGNMVYPALEAARRLEQEGLVAGVMNARYIKPIDSELLVMVANRCPKIITLEEQALAGGFGEAVLASLEAVKLEGRAPQVDVNRIGLPDQFIEHGAQKILHKNNGLDPESISNLALDFARGQSKASAREAGSDRSLRSHKTAVRK